MPIPSFPKHLPCPRIDPYGIQSMNPLQTAEMQTGRVRTRELWRNVPSTIKLSFRFTDEEMQDFEGFIKYALRNGADAFDIPLRTPNSKELRKHTVRLTEMYSGPDWVSNASPSRGYWDISFTALSIRDIRISEEDYINRLIGVDVNTAEDALDEGINTHWLPEYPENGYPPDL